MLPLYCQVRVEILVLHLASVNRGGGNSSLILGEGGASSTSRPTLMPPWQAEVSGPHNCSPHWCHRWNGLISTRQWWNCCPSRWHPLTSPEREGGSFSDYCWLGWKSKLPPCGLHRHCVCWGLFTILVETKDSNSSFKKFSYNHYLDFLSAHDLLTILFHFSRCQLVIYAVDKHPFCLTGLKFAWDSPSFSLSFVILKLISPFLLSLILNILHFSWFKEWTHFSLRSLKDIL